jgi:hypothetical protein
MKKENLIAQLEGAKALSSQVDIDKVIELIQGLEAEVKVEKVFGITQELAETLGEKIQRTLDYNSDRFVDKDSACFEINYNNQVELTEVNIDVYEIMQHVEAVFEEFVIEEDEPEEDDSEAEVEESEEGVLRDEEE